MLSGALLNTAMIGIVRYLAIVDAGASGRCRGCALVVLGVVSLLVAALFIVRQEGIKRLMAYSSVEHMGVIALGFGFGGPLGVAGALYHMLNHSLNKSLMFFGAGSMMRSYGTKDIGAIREVGRRFPVPARLWLAGAVAITGAPPFGLFAQRVHDPARRAAHVLRLGRHRHGGAADRDLRRLPEPFPGDVFRRQHEPDRRARPCRSARWCIAADVARADAAARARPVVARGAVELFRIAHAALQGGARIDRRR